MANITLKKSTIINIKSNLLSHAEELINTLSSITNNLNSAKEIYNTTGGAQANIDEIVTTIGNLSKSYNNKNTEFVKVMDESVMEYEAKEARASMEISSLDGTTVATMTVGASGLAGLGFNFGKIASNREDALNGKFIDESKVHSQYFGPGKYSFDYKDDGSVMISKDGQPMAWAQADNGKSVTGDIFATNGGENNETAASANSASTTPVEEAPKESVVTIVKEPTAESNNATPYVDDATLKKAGIFSTGKDNPYVYQSELTDGLVSNNVYDPATGTYVNQPKPGYINVLQDGSVVITENKNQVVNAFTQGVGTPLSMDEIKQQVPAEVLNNIGQQQVMQQQQQAEQQAKIQESLKRSEALIEEMQKNGTYY